jgi:membrane dipeptidase
MLIFDAHLDLAMNAMEWNRDLRLPVEEIRRRENGLTDKPDRDKGVVCFPEMRRGQVGLCVATQIARHVKPGSKLPGWLSPEQAWAQTQGQLAWYRAMEEAGELVSMRTRADLERQVVLWQKSGAAEVARLKPGQARSLLVPAAIIEQAARPIGYVLSLEGADSLVTLHHLEKAYAAGLRAVGLAHYGPGVYAQGTDASGGLGQRGRELLEEMHRLGMILDATHLCDESFWEALKLFRGPIWASHSNCRALVPHHRQLSDDQIKALIKRGAVIGAAFDAWMIIPDWVRGRTTPENSGLKIEHIVAHMDHICQLAGNANHVGIGSDLDGAFGFEQTPQDLKTIADLQSLEDLLRRRGFSEPDTIGALHGNFIRFLRTALPS